MKKVELNEADLITLQDGVDAGIITLSQFGECVRAMARNAARRRETDRKQRNLEKQEKPRQDDRTAQE